MGWVKRNLFFVIGGVLVLGLLGVAGFYDFTSWRRNTAAFDKLNEIYSTMSELSQQKPSATAENIAAAKKQEAEVRHWIQQARSQFQPIPAIPDPTNGPVTSELFASALHRTIDDLTREAAVDNVTLVPQNNLSVYTFSFGAEYSRVKFSPAGLPALATQLGEVKTIAEIMFAARVNQLDSIQRLAVSDDDTAAGATTDYITDSAVTNDLAVLTPYTVTFRSFSPEIAQVLAGFASSPRGFVVEGINVQPASGVMAGPDMGMMTAPGMTMTGPAPARGGLQTVLQEQLLRVTIEVEVMKLLPEK